MVKHFDVFDHVGFFFRFQLSRNDRSDQGYAWMNKSNSTTAKQIAPRASVFEQRKTGHAPKAVAVVLRDARLVSTLQGSCRQPTRLWLNFEVRESTWKGKTRHRGRADIAVVVPRCGTGSSDMMLKIKSRQDKCCSARAIGQCWLSQGDAGVWVSRPCSTPGKWFSKGSFKE